MTDGPDVLSFIVGTSSFTDILDNLELLSRIGRQDKRIATQVREARERRRRGTEGDPRRADGAGARRGACHLGARQSSEAS